VIEERDDRPHEPGDEPDWSESYYFAWLSPERSFVARIANRPNEGTQDVLVVTFEPDGATTLVRSKREERTNTDRLEVGGVRYVCEAPLKRWRLTCDADAVRLPNPRLLLGEEGPEPEPTRLTFDVVFDACQPPGELNSRGPDESVEQVRRRMASRHFEQTGAVTGTVDGEPFEGRGFRDKSWGSRDWSTPEMYRWFPMPFGDDLAANVFIARFAGKEIYGGWAWKDGSVHPIEDIQLDQTYGEDGRTHESVDVSFSVDGERLEVHGDVLNVVHVPYVTGDKTSLLNEGLARWRLGDREALGIAEYFHQLGDGDEQLPGPAVAMVS
jgi:hypothetical protein